MQVATDLLREEGRAGVTTRGVAERAGVQAPTIYRLFGDKEGLLDAVAEHAMASFASAKATASSSGAVTDPVDGLRAGWEMTVEFGLAHPELFVLISDPVRGLRSSAAQAGVRLLAERVHRLALAGRLRISEEQAVELIHAAGTGAVLATLARPVGERDLTLADSMFDAVLGRLLTGPVVPPSDGVVSSAIGLRAALPQLTALSSAERALMSEWLGRVIG